MVCTSWFIQHVRNVQLSTRIDYALKGPSLLLRFGVKSIELERADMGHKRAAS